MGEQRSAAVNSNIEEMTEFQGVSAAGKQP
jgi:hypothetical protein